MIDYKTTDSIISGLITLIGSIAFLHIISYLMRLRNELKKEKKSLIQSRDLNNYLLEKTQEKNLQIINKNLGEIANRSKVTTTLRDQLQCLSL